MTRAIWIVLSAAVVAAGCRGKAAPATERRSDAGPVKKFHPSGRRPVNATRDTPPPTMATALNEGAVAPDVALATVSGAVRGQFHLADVLAKERALLVFYRGDW